MTPKHYVIGHSSPFRKSILIPFWVVRVLVMCINAVLLGIALAGLAALRDEIEGEIDLGISYGAAVAVFAVNLVIVLFCLVLDIISIIKRATRTLSPRFFLITNVIQCTIWTVLFILSFIGQGRLGAGVAVSVIVYISFLGMLIYAGIIYHRFRKGRLTYLPAGQVDPSHVQNQGPAPYGHYGQYNMYPPPYPPAENHYKQPDYELSTQYTYGQQPSPSAWPQAQNQTQYPPPHPQNNIYQ
ncbi:hypothetical protein ACRALDRAFT_1081047 [Sodiomyces alcalophilus JCM 7366]|uniref:uncharacterized protein n=1 Tax=Sodiomyces alcalophilus JCM 7366 TaxID=591952 RepID=UPI0039B60958